MAHEIDMTNGTASCFTAGEPAWHRLGRNVKEAQTSAEAITLANLDWRIDLRPMFTTDGDGNFLAASGFLAATRSDTNAVLGCVGRQYRPFQNAEAFEFMDNIVGEKLAMFETAGALKGGRRVWMLARLPNEIRVAGDDIVHPYMLLTNSHDGTSGLRLIPTSVRVVCQNTLSLAMGRVSSSEGMSIVHTASLEQRVAEARVKMGVIAKRFDRFGEEVRGLARKSLNTEQLATYFAGLVQGRSEKQQKKLMDRFFENFHNARNAMPGIEGSAWAAYNAVSEWADHEINVRGDSETARLDARCTSIWFGTANTIKQDAWNSALALAI